METAVRSSIFTPEHEALRATVRAFVERELAPYAEEWEEAGDFPDWVFTKLGDAGYLGLAYPEEVGGQGGDYISTLVLKEEMARCGSGGVGMAVAVQTDMATPPILKFGTKEQIDRYLRPAIKGTKIACLGITEPGAGSDVANIQTLAVRDGSDWVINGRKIFITNGVRAHFCTLVARTNKPAGHHGFSLFLVPTDTPGWTVTKRLDKLGMHSSDTAEIALEDVRLPADALLGVDGEGFAQIMWELQGERLVGVSLIALSLILALPVPFGNAPMGLGIIIIALGLLEGDGRALTIGLAAGLAAALWNATLIVAGAELFVAATRVH